MKSIYSKCIVSLAPAVMGLMLMTGCQQTPPAPTVVTTPAPASSPAPAADTSAAPAPSTTVESRTTTRSSDSQSGNSVNPDGTQNNSSSETTKSVKKTSSQ